VGNDGQTTLAGLYSLVRASEFENAGGWRPKDILDHLLPLFFAVLLAWPGWIMAAGSGQWATLPKLNPESWVRLLLLGAGPAEFCPGVFEPNPRYR